ncbi:MAG: ATP-binding cassette domain-containing protein, partial [Rhodothermales bacterium]|nr:ATP-binding cassette domain-containing protein [Rhodothermales bacterium]
MDHNTVGVGATGTKRVEAESILELQGLRVHFPIRRGPFSRISGWVRAVNDISFRVRAGEVVGLVGESGSGKSTVARAIVRLLKPRSGRVLLEGVDVTHMSEREFRPLRRRVQMVFQDPFASLNPRMTVGDAIGEATRIHGLH